jgi:hypothetical protein
VDTATFRHWAVALTTSNPRYGVRPDFNNTERLATTVNQEEAIEMADFVAVTLEAEKPGTLQYLDYDLKVQEAMRHQPERIGHIGDRDLRIKHALAFGHAFGNGNREVNDILQGRSLQFASRSVNLCHGTRQRRNQIRQLPALLRQRLFAAGLQTLFMSLGQTLLTTSGKAISLRLLLEPLRFHLGRRQQLIRLLPSAQ